MKKYVLQNSYIKIIAIGLFLALTIGSCKDSNQQDLSINDLSIEDYQEMNCYFFFIADCPVSRNNLSKIQNIQDEFDDFGLKVIGVVSDPDLDMEYLYETLNTYKIEFDIVYDTTLSMAAEFNASVTPEFFLFNDEDQIVYQGLLDDYYYSLGKHKPLVQENYLKTAILQTLKNERVSISETKAIGCKINFDY